MVTLHDIMSVDVITVTPDTALREVAEVLADHHIGGVPVVGGGEVRGVISSTDILEFDAASRAVPASRPDRVEWGEWLEPEAWEEGEDAPSAYFARLWDESGGDVRARLDEPDSPEWNVLEEHTADEVMTRTLCTLPPEAEVREAAEYMLRAGVHRILVTRRGKLAGVVTTTDVVKAVAQYGLAG